MKLNSTLLEIKCPAVEKKIRFFIKGYIEKFGFDGIVLGISGGVDSSVVAALACSAIGSNKVIGLCLPEEETYSLKQNKDAKIIADKFNIILKTHDLSKILQNFYNNLLVNNLNKRLKGNIKARTRMIFLYYYANKLNKLVCGTSDKSETMIGYFTKWGDGAADIAPIMSLYKTQVQKLALYLGIPEKIAFKPPSPNLWINQSAESELGLNYELIDLILYGLEHKMSINKISKDLKLELDDVKKIRDKWFWSEHKRKGPITINV